MTVDIKDVRATELDDINSRRRKLRRSEIDPAQLQQEGAVDGLVGLALSGGGIRSASFCLGVLQALNQCNLMRLIDYLSTVSGGGYIGSSLTGTMTATGGAFVFGRASADGKPSIEEVRDTESVSHLRNYSNYLIPFGARDVVTAAAIVVRGLVANVAVSLPFVLFAAALTIWLKPTRAFLDRVPLTDADASRWRQWLSHVFPVQNFGVTLLLLFAGFGLFLLWALYRSFRSADKRAEFRGILPFVGSTYLTIVAISFFCEIQPFVLMSMFNAVDAQTTGAAGNAVGALWWQSIAKLTAVATPIAAVVTFFREQIGGLLKRGGGSAYRRTIAVVVAKAGVWIAGAALPLLIWVLYLNLAYWGIANYRGCESSGRCTTASVDAPRVCCDEHAVDASGGTLAPRCERVSWADPKDCGTGSAPTPEGVSWWHTPTWLSGVAQYFPGGGPIPPIAQIYLISGIVMLLVSYPLEPNANSLHQLYRDRLSKAFLFDPTAHVSDRSGVDKGRDFAPLNLKLSEISETSAPYHLINAALNIQGSDFANRRGRNADFFIFSKRFVGSEGTKYAETPKLETLERALDLGTAMAISGAAASSYMGAASIRPLAPTLALLNIRLGYWLSNPRFAGDSRGSRRNWVPNWFLWSEITGRLDEEYREVYLTDGGHIENLGLYELLRRHCKLIIVVDGEADPNMQFPSFIEVQRYARIDLGIRIDLGWEAISETTLAWMAHNADQNATTEKPLPAAGPHVAVGFIDYGEGEMGWLVYVKSSLSGDENDYIRDYARRHPEFPHETTGDQFFSEEQLEVYRALGFHAMSAFLLGSGTRVSMAGNESGVATEGPAPTVDADDERLEALRRLLELPVARA